MLLNINYTGFDLFGQIRQIMTNFDLFFKYSHKDCNILIPFGVLRPE